MASCATAVDIVVKASGNTAVTAVTKRKFVMTPLYLTGFVKTPATADTTKIRVNKDVPNN